MPVHKTKDGYKYGKTGKTYKKKKDAIKQAIAIAYSQAREEGREPTREEIKAHISGNPDKIIKESSFKPMKNEALKVALFKEAAAKSNPYGIIKVAEGIYGNDRRAQEAESYVKQREKILKRHGYELQRRGENFFTARGKPRESRWDYFNIFNWDKMKKAWRNWQDRNIKSEVSIAEGDAQRRKTAKRIARDFANGNSIAAKALAEELMRRSNNNVEMYKKTGKLREDAYTAPAQTHIEDDTIGGRWGRRRRRRWGRRSRLGLPEDDQSKYTYKNVENGYKSDNSDFNNIYKAWDPDTRRRFDMISAGV